MFTKHCLVVFIAGNGIYECSHGIHDEEWQCNEDRLRSLWVFALCNCQVTATVGKPSKY
jgi:hypothetical protein